METAPTSHLPAPGLRTSVTWLLQGLGKPQHWGICSAAEIAKPHGKQSCSHLIIGSRDYPTEPGKASALLTLTVGDLLL